MAASMSEIFKKTKSKDKKEEKDEKQTKKTTKSPLLAFIAKNKKTD